MLLDKLLSVMSCFVTCVSTFINIILLKHYSKLPLPPAFCYSIEVFGRLCKCCKTNVQQFCHEINNFTLQIKNSQVKLVVDCPYEYLLN